MKAWSIALFAGLLAGVFATLFLAGPAHAQSLYFSTTGGGASAGWVDDNTTNNWSTVTGGIGGLYTDSTWLSGADAYFEGVPGTVNVNGTIGSVNSINFTTDGYTLSGGIVTLNNSTGTASITTALNGLGSDSIGSTLSGNVGLTMNGPGQVLLTAANNYSGDTTITAGTLTLWQPGTFTGRTLVQQGTTLAIADSGGSAVGMSTLDTSGAGTLDLTSTAVSSLTLGGLSGPGLTTLLVSSPIPLTVGTNNANTTYSGALSSSIFTSLTKVGSGTLILSGSNTYQGGTDVEAGTLAITTASALPDGTSLTVAAGGTFVFDPSLLTGSPVTGGAVSAGAIAAVPEPGTMALLAVGLVVGIGVLRRKSKAVRN